MDERLAVYACTCGAKVFDARNIELKGEPLRTYDALPSEHGIWGIVAWGVAGHVQVWMGEPFVDEPMYKQHVCEGE